MNENYHISVEDFGPIAAAEIELRPLTILVGPSNTGKSYLAALLYALHRSLSAPALSPRGRIGRPRRPFRIKPRGQIADGLKEDIVAWVSKANAQQGREEEDSVGFSTPAEISGLLRQAVEDADGFGAAVGREVERCFGVNDLGDLRRRFGDRRHPRVTLRLPHRGGEDATFQLVLNSARPRAIGQVNAEFQPRRSVVTTLAERSSYYEFNEETDDFDEGHAHLDVDDFLEALVNLTFDVTLKPITRRNAYYMPAGRTGSMHGHHVIVSALLRSATVGGLRPMASLPMLSGVVSDFLDVLLTQISQLAQRRLPPRRLDFAKELEEEVLEGSIRVDLGDVGYPTFAYRPSGWKEDIPLMRVSSMVSELAPIVLYLRYAIRRGDMLIIEEPEAHLHPAKQAIFARELVSLVNAGVQVVMTTHSEWFLEQVGNLVQAGELPENQRRDLEALDSDSVGAWLFKADASIRGSVVEEIKIDEDTGLYPTDYEKVGEALYDENAKIFNRLQAGVD